MVMINDARYRVLRAWCERFGNRLDDHSGDCQRLCCDIRYGSYDPIAKQYSCNCVHLDYMMELKGLEENFCKYALELALHDGLLHCNDFENNNDTTIFQQRPCLGIFYGRSLKTEEKLNHLQAQEISKLDEKATPLANESLICKPKSRKDYSLSRISCSCSELAKAGFWRLEIIII